MDKISYPTQTVPINTIQPNPDNPRIIKNDKFEKLIKSIKEFPEMLSARPIVVDADMIILGGNMRHKAAMAAGLTEIPIIQVPFTGDKAKEFIIKDNVGFGEWEWDTLANEWDTEQLEDWGLDFPGFDLDADEFGEDFDLPDGDKEPFQQMTFTLADEQATQVKNAIEIIKGTEEYKYAETLGNENSNGNALYLIIMQWVEQRR